MLTPLAQRLNSIADKIGSYNLYQIFKPMRERYRTCAHTTAGLLIKAGGSTLAKTGTGIFHYTMKGQNNSIAASTDMPALVGTVNNAKFNIFVFTVNAAGTVSVAMGTEGATQSQVRWPAINTEAVIIGYIKINPTGTGNFVGGTTALDDGTVAPNAAYISPVGLLFPTAKVD